MTTNNNEPQVVLVDIYDRPMGSLPKLTAHQSPRLHRAFSVFLYNGSRMLIQQRAEHKYHSGGLWSNSCCSHPRPGEELAQAVQSRMLEELGIAPPVHEIFEFSYICNFGNGLWEYEYDHVFIGQHSGEIALNPDEAQAMRWIEFEDLERELVECPQSYSVWFVGTAPRVIAEIRSIVG